MDRREALKKMAVGGATIAGASVVMTAPAFAFNAPAPPTSPVVDVAPSGNTLTVTVSPGIGTCAGGSALSSSAEADASARSNFMAIDNISANTFVNGSGGPASYQFTVTRGGGAGVASSFRFDYRAQYRCSYPGGSATACREWRITIEKTGGGNNWGSPTPSFEPLGSSCP